MTRYYYLAFLCASWLFIVGCDDSEGDQDEDYTCGAGQFCHCVGPFDCPAGETCQAGLCLPPSSGGDTDDVVEDRVSDSSDDPTDDSAVEDRTTDSVEDPDSTVTDNGSDSTIDPDLQSDLDTRPDLVPDGSDASADADPDADATVDTGGEVIPWVALVSADPATAQPQIQLIRADGTGLTDYESDMIIESEPAWSRDGTMLVMTVWKVGLPKTLRVIDFDAGTLVDVPHGLVAVASPSWSPDGTQIVFEGHPSGESNNQLYIIDYPAGGSCVTETGCTQLTDPADADAAPFWTAGGSTIYFSRRTGGASGTADIYSIASTGGTPSRVTTSSGLMGTISLSPDDANLYYSNSTSLYRRTISGGYTIAIGSAGDSDASVFSDGLKMAITTQAYAGSDSEIAIVSASSGAAIQRLTDDAVGNSSPSVSPIHSGEINIENYPAP